MISDLSFYQGAVLVDAIRDQSFKSIYAYDGNRSSYVVNGDSGIYIKYSKKDMSPWHFTFSEDHMLEILSMHADVGRLFIVLTCGEDGLCCLDWDEFRTIISTESNIYPKWITASRPKGEKYALKGNEGMLKHKIGNSDFPRKIYEV